MSAIAECLNTPRFLTQSQLHDPDNGVYGTCMAACIAMVIGRSESEIPLRYLAAADRGEDWWSELNEDLKTLGWEIVYCQNPDLVEPKGWHLINGPSPRGSFGHSCLGYRGQLIWDPHPSRDGIVSVEDFYLLRRLEKEGEE